MSLQSWLESGWLRAHEPHHGEIAALLKAADRDLADARVNDLSTDRKFTTAYNAALLAATAALAASGYRAAGEGHHYRTIQSLAFTVQLDASTVQKLNGFRKKRNVADYEMIGMVSEQELGEMLSLAQRLRAVVDGWLRKHHPGLMRG